MRNTFNSLWLWTASVAPAFLPAECNQHSSHSRLRGSCRSRGLPSSSSYVVAMTEVFLDSTFKLKCRYYSFFSLTLYTTLVNLRQWFSDLPGMTKEYPFIFYSSCAPATEMNQIHGSFSRERNLYSKNLEFPSRHWLLSNTLSFYATFLRSGVKSNGIIGWIFFFPIFLFR